MSQQVNTNCDSPMVDWFKELQIGKHMYGSENGLQIKLVISPQCVKIVALAEHPKAAWKILQQLGFNHEKIKSMLCG